MREKRLTRGIKFFPIWWASLPVLLGFLPSKLGLVAQSRPKVSWAMGKLSGSKTNCRWSSECWMQPRILPFLRRKEPSKWPIRIVDPTDCELSWGSWRQRGGKWIKYVLSVFHGIAKALRYWAVPLVQLAGRLLRSIILFYPKIIPVHSCFVAEEEVDRLWLTISRPFVIWKVT